MPYFALVYDVIPGFVDRRTPYRPAHLQRVQDAHARGELVMAGALGDPADGALLIFRAPDAAAVEAFAAVDPYVTSGLVTHWRVRPWAVVVGAAAP